MKRMSCCFTGHHKLPIQKMGQIINRLNHEIDALIDQGIMNFISGGDRGFDQIAASLIVSKKETGADIRLIFALPYKNQDRLWSADQRRLYRDLLSEADEVVYVAEEYSEDCMIKLIHYMATHAAYCISTKAHPFHAIDASIEFVREKELRVINVCDVC